MRSIFSLAVLAATFVLAAPAAQAESLNETAAREQRELLLACQDRLFGVPPAGAETFMETTYNQDYPLVRVVEGGAVSAGQAHEINSCMARTLGFGGPLGAGGVTRSTGGIDASVGCPPGAPKLYRGTLFCSN